MAVKEYMRFEDIRYELEQDHAFIRKALEVLKEIEKDSTYTAFSAVSGLLNHWAVNRDLNYYDRKKVIDDVAALTVHYVEGDYEQGIKAVENNIEIKTQELAKLLQTEGFDLPDFLCSKPLHDSEKLNKHLNHLEIVRLWIETKKHCKFMHRYWELRHQKFIDEENVHYPEELKQAIKDNHELGERYLKKIHQAVADGDLKAETSIQGLTSRDIGWKVIPYSPTLLSGVKDDSIIYEGREVWVQHMIHRDDFRAWLEQSGQWPLAEGCALAKWFETEPQTEADGLVGTSKKRTVTKMLSAEGDGKPKERQNYFRSIWVEFEKPKVNSKIWTELRKRITDEGPIKNVFGNDTFVFIYQDGSIEQLERKTFQNDMTSIRNQK